jgi:hypothetical protein
LRRTQAMDLETTAQLVMAVIAFGVMYISFLKNTL